VIYTFIDVHCADLPVDACCRTMKVSRSAFHRWRYLQANPTAKMTADADLGELIVKIHDQSDGTYGVPRGRCCVVRSGVKLKPFRCRFGQIIEASPSNAAAQRRRVARASTPSS